MANTEKTRRPIDQGDGEAFKALEESLYTRLRDVLEPRIDALLEARAEYFLPEYYDRVVTSEIRRIESGIEYNGRRISELRSYMDQRFDDVDKRFEQIDKRFEQVDQRFEQVDRRFDQVDKRFEQIESWLGRIDGRLDRQDDRFDEVMHQLQETNNRIDRTVRNWVVVGFAFLGALFTIVQLFLRP